MNGAAFPLLQRRAEHWTTEYLGLPWVAGERDCWGFFRQVEKERFGREVPVIDIDATDFRLVAKTVAKHPERANWEEIAGKFAIDGDAVLMGRNKYPFHVGVFLKPRYVLHCHEGVGVVLQDLMSLTAHGWTNLRFYTPARS